MIKKKKVVEMSKTTSNEELGELFDIHELIEKLESLGEREVKTRTIHYYATKELLKPIGFGRNAKYSLLHVYRYKLIRLLQMKNLSLDQIREQLNEHDNNLSSLQEACRKLLEQSSEYRSKNRIAEVEPESIEWTAENNGYSHEQFWRKVSDVVLSAGTKVIYSALILHYLLTQSNIATAKRVFILSALAYFILPVDAVPDLLPGLGYTDDLGALISTTLAVRTSFQPSILKLAKERMNEWFARHRNLDKELEEVDRFINT
jgi:uncharacterized membrane protein YkvA (DUF1232 family)